MKRRLQQAIGSAALLSLALFGAGCDFNGSGTSDPPAAGTASIRLDGGNGYYGGGGGDLYVEGYAEVSFKAAGSADASFAVPAYNWTSNLGTNGATVASNTTVDLIYYGGGGTEPAAGTLYMLVQGDSIVGSRPYLFKSNGDNVLGQTSDRVTGLKVNGGVTLTLPANKEQYAGDGLQVASVQFENDVQVDGTLATAGLDNTEVDSQGNLTDRVQATRQYEPATSRDKAGLQLNATRILVNGTLSTAGANGTAAGMRGGDAGPVWLTASNGFVNRGTILASGGNGIAADGGNGTMLFREGSPNPDGVYIWDGAAILNTGAITTSGGSGVIGGQGGYIYLDSYAPVINTAALTANGGAGNQAPAAEARVRAQGGSYGGNAGYITFYSDYASVMNSGALSARGGDGLNGGGNGNYLDMVAGESGYIGSVFNSGAIDLSGGNATVAGDGGTAVGGTYNSINFSANGKILNSGAITATGGNGKGVGASAGFGGNFNLSVDYAETYDTGDDNGPGPITVSGTINLAGGNGGTGSGANPGDGGDIDVDTYADNYDVLPKALPVQFLGYGSGISSNGGDGVSAYGYNEAGGDAGDVTVYTDTAWSFDDYFQAPTPSIYNDVKLTLRGGNASGDGARSGHGGDVTFETYDESSYVTTETPLGFLTTVTNKGDIDARGGTATGADARGYHGGNVYFYAYNKVTNTGSINVSGGDATGAGGTGGDTCEYVEMYSTYDIENTGSIAMNGGNATGANGYGGDASGCYIDMYAGGNVRCTGALSINGGNGTGTGTNGSAGEIDLFSQTGATTYGALSAAKGTGGEGAGSDGAVWVDWVLLFGAPRT
jgi:hypothetical protein